MADHPIASLTLVNPYISSKYDHGYLPTLNTTRYNTPGRTLTSKIKNRVNRYCRYVSNSALLLKIHTVCCLLPNYILPGSDWRQTPSKLLVQECPQESDKLLWICLSDSLIHPKPARPATPPGPPQTTPTHLLTKRIDPRHNPARR